MINKSGLFPEKQIHYWTLGRADRGPINSVPSVHPSVRPSVPSAMGIFRERFIQFFHNLVCKT